MIENRVTQTVFQTVYCVLAAIGFLSSLGCFDARFNGEFYIYYTNLSNDICMGAMFATLFQTVGRAKRKEDGCCETAPIFHFLCVIMILVTFLVYNILLAKEKTAVEYFTSLSNLIMHLILPVMFVLNWALFYRHSCLKWYHPLLCLIMPLAYVAFIFVRAAILQGNAEATKYPYFFLNAENLGWGGVIAWIAVLIAVFVGIAYLLYGADRIKSVGEKIRRTKS
ncbi:MAG: Pr6Pr family membrane protein [Candidatus Gallimonas sp.]